MIFLTLFILLFADVVAGTAEQSEQYLIYAIKGECESLLIYKTDFNLQNQENILIPVINTPVTNWFINHYEYGDVLYLSYQDSDMIRKLNMSSRDSIQANISGDSQAVFLRPRSDDELYFYFPKENKIRVYNFTALLQEDDLCGLAEPNNTLSVVKDLDCDENRRIYTVECSETKNTVKILELNRRDTENKFEIPKCPDKVAFTPDAKKFFLIIGSDLYEKDKKIYTFDDKRVESFAAGNDVIFFTTSEYGKIFKLTKDEKGDFKKTKHEVPGTVTALVVKEPRSLSPS